MKPKKRQKLCYNCEGEVDLDVIVCPFCAADLREEKPELGRSSFSPSVTSVKQLNTQHSLYSIPYQQEEVPTEQHQESTPLITPQEEEPRATRTLLTALVLFTLGVHLFLLGVLLVIFSDRGTMILKWDASLWFFYIFASVPLLLFGYRYLNRI
jgi:hypothetical protein